MRDHTFTEPRLVGHRQELLTSFDQLEPGVLITGPQWSTIRRVQQVESRNAIWFTDVAGVAVPCEAHTLGEGNNAHVCTICASQKHRFADIEASEDAPRSWVLVPTGELHQPDAWSTYVPAGEHAAGTVLRVERGTRRWIGLDVVPAIPAVTLDWSVPVDLRLAIEAEER